MTNEFDKKHFGNIPVVEYKLIKLTESWCPINTRIAFTEGTFFIGHYEGDIFIGKTIEKDGSHGKDEYKIPKEIIKDNK